MMKYYYEYKIKNGAKVGGHNLEGIKFNDDIIILTGEDTINGCFGEIDRSWRTFLKANEIEYLKIDPMEEDEENEQEQINKNSLYGICKDLKKLYINLDIKLEDIMFIEKEK